MDLLKKKKPFAGYNTHTHTHISCSAPCSETEEKLWDLWNVNLHREALKYINTRLTSNMQRKAEWGTFAGGKEQREVKSKPWAPCLIPQVSMGNAYSFSACFSFFMIFICFLPGAGEANDFSVFEIFKQKNCVMQHSWSESLYSPMWMFIQYLSCFFSVQGTTLDSQVEMYIASTSFIQQM